MKKWTVLILAVLAVFFLSAAAYADPEPEPAYFSLELRSEQQQREPNFLLWAPDFFEIHTNIVRNSNVLFYFDENADPIWAWVNDDGYGEVWFTSGTTDVNPYDLGHVYNENNLVRHYKAHLEYTDDNGEVIAASNELEYTAGMTSSETPAYHPEVTDATAGAIRQDGVFSVTVSNEADFQTMCVALFDEDRNCVVDSHWVDVVPDAGPTVIDTPLLKLHVNQQYTAKIFGLMHGRPMSYADETFDILVLSPDSQAAGTDILMRGLRDEYQTGELIMPIIYYPNSEGMENIQMEIAVFASRFENTHWRWDSNLFLWPDETGGIYYQPEVWDNPIYSWNDGEHVFRVKIWLNEDDQHILLDSFERRFNVTSSGPITAPPVSYDPGLPVSIDADSLPYTITVPRPDAENYRMYGEVYDPGDGDYHEGFWYDDSGDEPMEITVTSPSQRVYVCIQVEKHGYDLYERESMIPVVHSGGRLSLWTDDSLTGPLPLHADFPIWVSAPGADWIEAENIYGCFFREEDPFWINNGNPIEFSENIHDPGDNLVIATAQFTDNEGSVTVETAAVVVQGFVEGDAGAFTASVDRDNVERGETVTVSYTKSENSDHYWVDVDTWNEDRGEWDWYMHLADLYIRGENDGGTALLNTMELDSGKYRLRALAEGAGYYAAETVITENFTVRDPELPDNGILVSVTSDRVETCEDFQVSAYAPGAEWMEVYWDWGNNNWNCNRDDMDSRTWDGSYDRSGTYRIAVKAGRDARDNDGSLIWEHDDDGNTWVKQDEWWSDPVTVAVSAENGFLTLVIPDGIPSVLAPSDDEEISFTVQKPENAETVSASAWFDDDGFNLFWDYTRDESLPVSVHTPLEAGQTLCISLHAQARGYESADLDLRIPVLDNTSSDLVQLTMREENFPQEEGKYLVPMGSRIRFLVGAAQGHELTAAKLYTPDGWWCGGEEIRHDNHEDWFENGKAFFETDFGNERNIGMDVPVYAVARIDDSDDWITSEVIWVRQLDAQIGTYRFMSETTLTVERGRDAVFTFSSADGADNYWVDAWDVYGDNNSYNPYSSCSGTTVTMNTAQLPEGEFIIRGRAGADGKGWRESDNSVRLIVTAGTVPYGEVRLTVDRTEALTGEAVSAGVYAPGADWVEIIREHAEDDWWDRFADNGGEYASGSFSEGDERIVQVYARAHYFERDEYGNTVYVQDEYDEYPKELPYTDSETVTVTFTAPNGLLVLDGSGIPVSALAGTDLPLYLPVPDHADRMDWDLFLNRDYDDYEQQPDYSGRGALSMTVPGSDIAAGNTLNLRAWADGTGYTSAYIDLPIRVLEAHEDRITLSVSKSTVEVNEDFTVTVSVDAPGVDFIQYYNGNTFWSYWDDTQEQEVNQNLELDQNGQWIFNDQNYDDAGVKALYARAWIDGKWVASDPVKVTVTRKGKVGAFSVSLEEAAVTRGDTVTLSYTVADHSDESRYDLHHDRNRENDGEDWVHYDLDWRRNEEENTITFPTAGMPAGEYRLRVRAQGTNGYESRESSEVLLTVNEPAGNAVRFEIAKTTVQTNENLQVALYAPGACRGEIHWQENDTWDFNIENECWLCSNYGYGSAGVYRVFARVWYPDQQDQPDHPVDSDIITVTVTSKGQMIPFDFSHLPAGFIAGADAQITVPRPDGSDYMDWEIFINDEPYADNHNGDFESLNQVIPGDRLQENGLVHLKIWTGAVGYEHNHQEIRFPVIAAADDEITLTVSENPVPVNKDFTVTVCAPGASYIQYYNGFDFWKHWDDNAWDDVITNLDPDEDGKWVHENENFGSAGIYTLYARAWVPDAGNEDGGYWITSAPVAVTVTRNDRVGDFNIHLEEAAVTRGDLVRLNYTAADHSNESGYQLHHDRNRENDGENWVPYNLYWERDEGDNQITFSTAEMPAGEYWLSVWAPGLEGYEGRETGRIWLTVSEPAGNTVGFEVSKSTLQTNEDIQASVYAPGACRGEIHWHENDIWDFEGEIWSGRYSYGDAGVYQAFARVWYPDQQDPVDSDMITITVTSNGKKIPLDLSHVPARIIAGTDTTVMVPRPDGAGYMDWEIYIHDNPEPYAHNHYGDFEFLNQLIPGTDLQEGDTVRLMVWTGAAGYDNNYQELRIPVVGRANDGITFTMNSGSVGTCENVSCTAAFPAGVYSKIQFFDGERYQDEDTLAEDETSRPFETSFGINGTYTVYARLQREQDGEWVYTPAGEVTVTAPYGPLTLDVSGVPARIYEGNDVTFTLGDVTDKNGNPVGFMPNYELYYDDGTGSATHLIRWDDEPKTGTITIRQSDIAEGRVYTLNYNYNVFAGGYEPVMGRLDIRAYAGPAVTMSVDKKAVSYGETVTFTVNAPGANSCDVVWWQDDTPGAPLGTLAWEADEIGTFLFGATAAYDGFGTVTTARPVAVTVRSLGEAPAPSVDMPVSVNEGAAFRVVVRPAQGGWVTARILDSNGDEVQAVEHAVSNRDLTVSDALAGTYWVQIEYGKDGYDNVQTERSIRVDYWYNGTPPEWTWADDFSTAHAVLTSLRGDSRVEVEAEISHKVTTEPTCGATGIRTHTATVTYLGEEYQDARTETLDKTEHVWNNPVFTWTETEGGYSAAATFTCKNDGAHSRTENAEVTVVRHLDATCTEPEATVYRAACEGFSENKTVEGEPAQGHHWEWGIVWNDDYTAYAERRCDHCGASERSDVEVVRAVTREATCQLKEEVTYSVDVTLNGQHLESSRKQYTSRAPHTPDEPAFSEDNHFIYTYCKVCRELLSAEFYGHHWGEPVYVWADDCSCVTATHTCNLTPNLPHSETETVSASGRETRAATCLVNGETTYTSETFENPDFTVQTKAVDNIPALGHDWGEPAYEWAEGNSQVTATRICSRDAGHILTETVKTTAALKKSPTENEPGIKVYTAAFENPAFSLQEKEEEIPAGLAGLTVLRLPSALKTIGREAFANLACEAIVIPDGCTAIEEYAFAGCRNLVYVRIPSSVTGWPENAFENCSAGLVIDYAGAD